jgi:hypothetical protein
VAAWQGHDVKVAVKHYAMVTDGDFEAATAASVLKNVLTERTDQYQPTSTNEAQHTPSPSSQTPSFLGDSGALCASLDSSGYSDQRRGWDSNTLENDRGFRGGVLNCVLTANDRLELAELIEAWLELDRPLRAPFLAMIRAGRTRSG